MKSFRAAGLKDGKIHLSAEAVSEVDLEKAHEDVGPLGYCDSANFVFTDVRYRVPSLRGGKVDVLKGVSGACKSGRLLALMGASGRFVLPPVTIIAGLDSKMQAALDTSFVAGRTLSSYKLLAKADCLETSI